jgi:hypothetical protein
MNHSCFVFDSGAFQTRRIAPLQVPKVALAVLHHFTSIAGLAAVEEGCIFVLQNAH